MTDNACPDCGIDADYYRTQRSDGRYYCRNCGTLYCEEESPDTDDGRLPKNLNADAKQTIRNLRGDD